MKHTTLNVARQLPFYSPSLSSLRNILAYSRSTSVVKTGGSDKLILTLFLN